jgi:hypothetical protein
VGRNLISLGYEKAIQSADVSARRRRLASYQPWLLRLAYPLLLVLLLATVSLDRLHWLLYDKAWINPFHEGFALAFMPAIRMEGANDIWYHYFGLSGLTIVTRLLHEITQSLLGTSEFTFNYFDLFGKLFFVSIYAGVVASVIVIAIRTWNLALGIPLLAMFLVLNCTTYFSGDYHRIVNTLGFFELYFYFYTALIVCMITSFQKGNLPKRAPVFAVVGGGMAGSLLFDLSIFGWLFVFFATALFVLTEGRQRWQCFALTIVAGVVIGLFTLWMAYAFHLPQATIAFFYHLSVIAHGVGLTQPGFEEQFFGLFLSPKSTFFQRHIIIACAVAIWIISILKDILEPPDLTADQEQRVLRLLGRGFDLALILTVLGFGYTLFRHPTSTVADSLTLLCLFYSGFRLSIAVCVKDSATRTYLRMVPLSSIVVLAGLAAGYLPYPNARHDQSVANLFRFDQPGALFFSDPIEGRLVRSLDHFIGKFAEHYTVLDGPYSYWMSSLAIYPLRFATTVSFTGSGVPGGPRFLPIQAEVEQTYVRRYHFVTESSAVGFLDSCQAGNLVPAVYADLLRAKIEMCVPIDSPLGSKVFNLAASRLRLGDEAYLFPYPIPLGNAAYDAAVNSIRWRTPSDAGSSSPRHLLSTAERIGLKIEVYKSNERSFGWSLIPVELEVIREGLTPFVVPIAEGGYRSYLLRIDSTMFTTYLAIFVRNDVAP